MPSGTIPSISWGITIETGVNDAIVFDENGGASGPWTATIAAGTYYWNCAAGDGLFTSALDTAFAAVVGPANNYTFAPNDMTGILTVTADTGGVNSRLLLSAAGTTLDPAILGFTAATKTLVGGPVYTVSGDFQVGRAWFPEQIYVDDSEDLPVYTVSQQQTLDGGLVTALWGQHRRRTISIDVLPANKVFSGQERAAHAQEGWLAQTAGIGRPSEWIAAGETFAFVPDYSTPAVYGTYRPLGQAFLSEQPFATSVPGLMRYDFTLPMAKV